MTMSARRTPKLNLGTRSGTGTPNLHQAARLSRHLPSERMANADGCIPIPDRGHREFDLGKLVSVTGDKGTGLLNVPDGR